MLYRVVFERPVRYLADSPVAARTVTELAVYAPEGQSAIAHALRVTQGDPGMVQAWPTTEGAPEGVTVGVRA